MNPILLKLGPIELRYYGLMYAIAFTLSLFLGKKMAKRKGIDVNIFENYAMTAIVGGLIGGRLYYVALKLDYYLSNPMEIPAVWHGGMAIHGGIIGAIVAAFIYAKIKKVSFKTLLDIGAPLLLLGQGIGRFGNFMNGEVHGFPTFTPWSVIFSNGKFSSWWDYYQNASVQIKMQFEELVPFGVVFPPSSPAGQEFPNTAVHPAMLYELVLNFIGASILFYLFYNKNLKSGILACIYIIFYGFIRFFVSFFRAEDLMVGGMRAPHLISLIMIITSFILILIIKKQGEKDV